MEISNRLVRSATWDPCLFYDYKMTSEVVDHYRRLAQGGVGMIITGGFPVYEETSSEGNGSPSQAREGVLHYHDLRVEGIEKLPGAVHQAAPCLKIVAQLELGRIECGPSAISSPFSTEKSRALTQGEISDIASCYIEAIEDMRLAGFDGVQLHAAHRSLLGNFLSPYTNHRTDGYGGSVENRTRFLREIVSGARALVGDFPILVKMNGTDYVPGGIDLENFPTLASEVARTGVDAIEVSGGIWDCLVRSEAELGFRPVPSPEAHTRLHRLEQQSYFAAYAERLDLDIPVILVGGNRNVELLEQILQRGRVDFVALCRPFISEPDLPNRWRLGVGKPQTDCISCNSCLYAMLEHPGSDRPRLVSCVFKHDKSLYKEAQHWLITWVDKNKL